MKKTITIDELHKEEAEARTSPQKARFETHSAELMSKHLLNELQVHQVELEAQNEELRQANDEISEHKERLHNIIKKSPAGYFHIDLEGRFLDVNGSWLRMHGYGSAKEVIGKHFSMLQVDGSSDSALAHLAELQRGVPIPYGEFSSRRKNGSVGHHIFSAHPVERMGAVVGFEWFIIDITERKVAENEIKSNERRMASLYEISQYPFTSEQEFLDHALSQVVTLTSSSIGYIYLYSEQKRQFILNSWSKEVMTECAVQEQQTTYDLDSTGIWGEAVRQRKPILLNDFQAHNPLKKGVPDGHVVLRRFLTVPIVFDKAIIAIVGVANKEDDYNDVDTLQLTLFMDAVWKITTSKRAEKEKAILQAQLQQTQKIESIGQLAGGVAHDFNNMLGVILGHAEMALMKADPSSPFISDLQEISNAAQRSATLTRQLLTFARKQVITPKVLDLNEAVASTLNMLQRLIGENIQLTWNPAAKLWPVKVDPSQVDQILANLCVNARDAIAGIGKILIKTENRTLDESVINARPYEAVPGDYVLLSVSDSGCGMDKQIQAHIFEPFYTTKEVGTGTGLGLSTVYGAVKQNHGFLTVYSEMGLGTVFNIYLPRTSKVVAAKQETVEKPLLRGTETILLVEDDKMLLDMEMSMLEESGYTVLPAITADLAQTLAREHSGPIHLLISDMIMPVMNGKELSVKLQPLRPEMKVLFLSGYTAEIISNDGMIDESIHFLQKPFSLEALTAKVRDVLDDQ